MIERNEDTTILHLMHLYKEEVNNLRRTDAANSILARPITVYNSGGLGYSTAAEEKLYRRGHTQLLAPSDYF